MLTNHMNLIKGYMLVGLEEIFDLRLGTIAAFFGREKYRHVIECGYYSRTRDVFDGIDPQEFQKAYKQKSVKALSLSTITQIPELLKDFVKKVNTVAATTPVQLGIPRIDVNFHGFDMPDEVKQNILAALRIYIGDRCIIEDVNYSLGDLTPEFVRLSYDHWILYNISDWLEYHSHTKEWEKGGCPTVTLFLPALMHGDPYKEIKDFDKECELFMEAMTPVIGIRMIPSEAYSSAFNPALLNKDLSQASEAKAPDAQVDLISPHPQESGSTTTSRG